MKKFYLLMFMASFACFVFGQVYFEEDFSDGTMPPTGWTIENQDSQWSNEDTDNAGGVAPEAQLSWVNTIDLTRLISPEIDLTETSDVAIYFRHFLDNYSGTGYSIGISTRSGGGDWNVIWEENPSGDIGPERNFFFVDTADAGASDFQFCFYVDGNLYNFDYWYIDDVSVLTPYDLDLELTSINLPTYVAIDSELDLTGMVFNAGTTNITSFDIAYTINDGDPVVASMMGLDIPLGGTYGFTHDTPIVLTEDGSYEIVVNIENINGGDDDNPDNNTQMGYVVVVPFVPAKKVFGEEATGTWCGWCTRGTCFMDYMAETYPDTWIGVAVHNSDPMVNDDYDAAIPDIIPNFPGYPSGTVDRFGDNYLDPSEFEAAYLQRMQAISPASVDITNFLWNPETRVVTFDVESEFIVDVNSELRFAAVLVEDSLWGTTSQWAQANYYSGGGNGPMCGYEDLPDPIPAADMHYDHVARDILGTPHGTEGSLPETILAGETHSWEFLYIIPQAWNYDNMHFVGLLIDYTTGEVLNCNNVINYTTEVSHIASENEIKIYPNPSAGQFFVEGALNSTINVYNTTGSLVASHVDFSANKIDLSELDTGIYFISITLEDNTTINKKVSLMK